MSRVFTFLLALIFYLPLTACSDNPSSESTARVTTVANGEMGSVLRLVFLWSGDDLASRQDLETRSKVEALIAARRVGKILRTGSGMGWMDIWIAVENPTAARRALETIVASAAPGMKYAIQTGGTDNE